MNSPLTATRRWSGLADAAGWLGGLVAIGWFAVLLFQYHIHFVPEVDSQGYFLMARSFSQFQWPRWPEDLGRFFGHVWVQVGEHHVMAKYPPGWPVLLALGYWVGGLAGALWVNPILAVSSAIAFFLLAWRLFNSTVACICTTLWLFSPMVPAYLNYPLSHTADVTLVLLAFLLTVVWAQTGRGWAAVGAGLCAGFLPAIRPVNVFLWPALVALIWATATRRPGRVRFFLTAWAGPVALLAAYNWFSFGAPWRTGYALTAEQTGFDWRLLGDRGGSLATTAQTFLEPRWWWLILAGLVVSWRRWKLTVTFALWIVPFLLIYGSYYYFHPNETSLRFLLATLPAAILGLGFLVPTDGRWRFAMWAGFGLWLALAPPVFLVSLKKIQTGQRYTNDEVRASAAIRLTGMFTQMPTRYPAALLHRQLGHRPAAIYATGPVGWTLGAGPGVIHYDLENWAAPHFFKPPVADCAQPAVWEDPRRHAHRHAWYARLGEDGLRQDFLHHIRHDLAMERAVYFADNRPWPMRKWLRAESDLIVEPAEIPTLLRIRQGLPSQ